MESYLKGKSLLPLGQSLSISNLTNEGVTLPIGVNMKSTINQVVSGVVGWCEGAG